MRLIIFKNDFFRLQSRNLPQILKNLDFQDEFLLKEILIFKTPKLDVDRF